MSGFSGNFFHPRLLINRFFSLGAAEITTPAADLFSNIVTTNKSVVSIRKDSHTLSSVPTVSPSSGHVPVNSSDHNETLIKPDPIKITTFLSAEDLVDFETYTGDDKNAFIDENLRKLRKTFMMTKNAMASRALANGAYHWTKRANDGKYVIVNTSLGSKTTITAQKGDWDVAATTLADIWEDYRHLAETMQDLGFGSFEIRCGRTVFNALMNKVNSFSNDFRISAVVEPGRVLVNGVPFIDDRLRYNDLNVYGTASTSYVVDDDYLLITANTDPNGAFQTVFGPVYNTRAGLKSSQVWIDRQEAVDGSGYHLYLEATPMFIMNPEGIGDMKVTNNT